MRIDQDTINMILKTLEKGHRIELIPVKDGVKVIHVQRKEIKTRRASNRGDR